MSDENPKTLLGRLKPGQSVVSQIGRLWLTAVHEFGARRYGAFNWRVKRIPTNIYLDAIQRHLDEYATGVDNASDSGLPHLAHIAANCLILLDAQHAGTLDDDRHKITGYADVMEAVARAKASWKEAA